MRLKTQTNEEKENEKNENKFVSAWSVHCAVCSRSSNFEFSIKSEAKQNELRHYNTRMVLY